MPPPPLIWPTVAGGLAGAAGITLSTVAAHIDFSYLVSTAAAIALAHAPLLILLSLPGIRRVLRRPALPAQPITLGLILFCGDLTACAFLDFSFFKNAAPTGGTLLILDWLLVALPALPNLFSRNDAA
ncbi:DUF423 domain-containing protein [Breoghania sp.]|uniref:DUF423 domain-containing protein n=1 Tax=Breoghania sp. TaxID=2065378 RepID=UPI00261546F9|nr:DUF423 domain-containing protein [Breoghania sp.]MDJ0932587.1 DUF423 domain-containing protein [Breoghania sp.]